MVKPLFALSNVPETISEVNKNDCLRIKHKFGWYFQTARKGCVTLDEFVDNAKAPIAHHFHNHEWCNSEWCAFKNLDQKELNELLEKNKLEKVLKKKNEKQLTIKRDCIFDNSIEKNYNSNSDSGFDA